jgi:hypothetical protein
MADLAYAFFFVAILLGAASFLHVSLQREWRRIAAALNSRHFQEVDLSPNAGQVNVRERPQPILQPVRISICRL